MQSFPGFLSPSHNISCRIVIKDINSLNADISNELLGLLLDSSAKKLQIMKHMEQECLEKAAISSFGFRSVNLTNQNAKAPKLLEAKSNLEVIAEASDGKESESVNGSVVNPIMSVNNKTSKLILSKLCKLEEMISNIALNNQGPTLNSCPSQTQIMRSADHIQTKPKKE